MDFRQYFDDLFSYNHWSNCKYLAAICDMNAQREQCMLLMSHIIHAQQLWMQRINTGISADSVNIWREQSIEDLIKMNDDSSAEWHRFVNSSPSFHATVEYLTLDKERASNMLHEIITHVINHGTYHRAQLAKIIRNTGKKPPQTDYIIFKREIIGA